MHKLFILVPLLLGLSIFGDFSTTDTPYRSKAEAEQTSPPYAKWGQLAMKETKEKYPHANIIDYLHIGRETGSEHSKEKFKLWLKTDSSEFGVFVDITFNNATEQVVDIHFKETTR